MERCKIITHKEKSIIQSDLTNFSTNNKEDLQEAINKVKVEIAKHPPGSVLILTDVTGLRFDAEITKMFADYIGHNKPYIKASAVVGIAGMMQFVFFNLLHSTLRDIKNFDSAAEALDWLVEQ